MLHPLHALFSKTDTETAANGTKLQRELRCNYCPQEWELHRYSTGERQGKWRVVDLEQLRDHMLRKCSHGSNDILSVARAASRKMRLRV